MVGSELAEKLKNNLQWFNFSSKRIQRAETPASN